MRDLPLTTDDESWLASAVERLVHYESTHTLPPVSSALSARIFALESECLTNTSLPLPSSVRLDLYVEAVKSLASSYQTTLRSFAPHLPERGNSRGVPIRVLSVCTGFDALVEVIALTQEFGDLAHYVSVELNEAATRLNHHICSIRGPRDASLRFISADIRSRTWLAQAKHEVDHFDLCIALYPPITQTAYGDMRRVNPGERLSDHSDSGVILELLNEHEQGHLEAPIGMVFYEEREAQYLRIILEVLGYGDEIEFRVDPLPNLDFFVGTHQEDPHLDPNREVMRHSARIYLNR